MNKKILVSVSFLSAVLLSSCGTVTSQASSVASSVASSAASSAVVLLPLLSPLF